MDFRGVELRSVTNVEDVGMHEGELHGSLGTESYPGLSSDLAKGDDTTTCAR